MLWVNHGRCVYPLGARRAEYYHEVRLQISRFIRRLFRAEAAPTAVTVVRLDSVPMRT